jgi:hypothetical protein
MVRKSRHFEKIYKRMKTDENIRTFSPHASIRDFLPDCTDNSDRQGTISIIAIIIYISCDHSFC